MIEQDGKIGRPLEQFGGVVWVLPFIISLRVVTAEPKDVEILCGVDRAEVSFFGPMQVRGIKSDIRFR